MNRRDPGDAFLYWMVTPEGQHDLNGDDHLGLARSGFMAGWAAGRRARAQEDRDAMIAHVRGWMALVWALVDLIEAWMRARNRQGVKWLTPPAALQVARRALGKSPQDVLHKTTGTPDLPDPCEFCGRPVSAHGDIQKVLVWDYAEGCEKEVDAVVGYLPCLEQIGASVALNTALGFTPDGRALMDDDPTEGRG